MPKGTELIPVERIEEAILLLRGQRVLLDEDLAELYEVETKNLIRAVKRNMTRFPDDFMFQLTQEEFDHLRCQNVTSKIPERGGRRYLPYAFTEQGVAMLSSVLRSPRAVQVNVEIMRAFVRIRRILGSHEELARKVAEMEKQLQIVVWYLFSPRSGDAGPTRRIGFRREGEPETPEETPEA